MRILIVEDEALLARQLRRSLESAGYVVDHAPDGAAGEYLGATEACDLAILDLGLPGMDGLTVLQRWREAGLTMPVLIVTARGSWSEKVQGIDAGADDYLSKPFRMEELLARVRALLRRAGGHATGELRHAGVTLDPRSGRVTKDGVPIRLTGHELRVLSYLMHQNGRAVPSGELVEHIYAQSFDRESNTVEVFIARLRRKLGASFIETVRGIGYRLGGSPS